MTMGAHGQEDWFDEVMPGLDAVRPGGKRRFPWPGRHGKDDGDEAEARTRPRIGVRVGVATVIVTGLMVGAGLTAEPARTAGRRVGGVRTIRPGMVRGIVRMGP